MASRGKGKAASSSGAASFSGGFGSGFGSVGFGSVESVSLDGLSPDNALIFKKIVKKDATTKIKGLEELRKFIEENTNGEHENLTAVLNKWTSEFPRLMEDNSPKVRLLAVKLMGLIGKTFKAKLMSNLKELIPAWICGLNDPRKEIGDAALEGLRSTIPESKHDQTISFVRKGIIDYVEAHLSAILDTSSRLLTSAPTAEEDSEGFSRICSTNVQLLVHLCERLKPEEFNELSTRFKDLLDTHVQRLTKSVDPKIRGDLYSLWAALLRHTDFIKPQLESFSKIIITSIADDSPQTQSKAWGALVMLFKSFEIFSQPWFNLKKLFLPSLAQSLKSPHATPATYESLLPMLSTIPTPSLSLDLLNAFFPDLWRALKNEGQVATVVTAYFDCLIFVLPRVDQEMAATLFDKHFMPIFEGYFTYEKELSTNITQTITLFITRLQAKPSLDKTLTPQLWQKLQEIANRHFLLKMTELREADKDTKAADSFAIKFNKFMLSFQEACAEAKQPLSETGALMIFTQLLDQPLEVLHQLGFKTHIESLAATAPVWRAIPRLTMEQELKKAQIAKFVAEHKDAPRCLTDMVHHSLTSSLHMSLDNSEWQTLLTASIKQGDFSRIRSTLTQDKDAGFWQCDTLDKFAQDQADIDLLEQESSILPLLVAGNESGNFLRKNVLIELAGKISPFMFGGPTQRAWTKNLITNTIDLAGALILALSREKESVYNPFQFLTHLLLMGRGANSPEQLLLQQMHGLAQHKLAEVLPKALKIQRLHSICYTCFSDIPSGPKSTANPDVSSTRATAIRQRAALASTFLTAALQADRLYAIEHLALVLPTEDVWNRIFDPMVISQRVDPWASHPLVSTQDLQKATTPSETPFCGYTMAWLEYLTHLIPDILGLEQLVTSQVTTGDDAKNATNLDASNTSFNVPAFVALTSQLLACETLLAFPLSASCSEAERTLLPGITAKITSTLTEVLLPILLIHSPSGAFQLTSHIASSEQPSWIKASTLARVCNFVATTPSLSAQGQAAMLSHIWTHVLSVSPQRISLLSGFKTAKWIATVDTKLSIAKALSDLYQLKPVPGSAVATTDEIGYQLLAASTLVPHAIESVDSRKISEIFSFATKHAFAVASNTSLSITEERFLIGIAHYLSSVTIGTEAFSSRLTEANYAVLFDLTEKLLSIAPPKSGKEVDSLSHAALVLLDSLSGHVFSLGTMNTDAALFFQKNLTPLCAAWSSLASTYESWPASYLQRWARVMRFVPGSVITRLDGESIGSLYQLIGTSTDIKVQASTFVMLSAVIKDHNAHTYTKSLSESTKLAAASSSDEDSLAGKEELLESKLLPDQLQHLVLDVKLGYEDPLAPEEILTDEDPVDRHVYDVSVSACASTLLGWRLILEYLNSQDEKEKNDLITWIRQSDLLQVLIPLVCHLVDLQSPPNIEEPTLERFLVNHAHPDANASRSQEIRQIHATLRGIAYFILRDVFEFIPALLRTCWQHSDAQLRAQLEQYAGKMISPQLIQKEVSRAAAWKPASPMLDEFKVKASSIGEVVATYQKDEVELSITLKMSAAHPLKPVNVTMSHKAVSEALWRKWLLSMRSMLLTRDGSVLDAVLLWRDYLDRHFEGVECCPICYAIFHISNYTLPNLACKTCKNKFHKACLYKWFNTSHNNECPLCKTPFN